MRPLVRDCGSAREEAMAQVLVKHLTQVTQPNNENLVRHRLCNYHLAIISHNFLDFHLL